MKVLIVDDDPQIRRALRVTLNASGYDVVTAADGAEAVRLATAEHADIYLIDLGLPAMSGFDVIHAVRGWSTAPIIVLSGRSDSADKVDALDAGADDYVTKPFAIDELLARLRALSRRSAREDASPVVTMGDVTIDLSLKSVTRRVEAGTESVRLTPTEWRVLELLVRNPERLVTRQEMLADIWGSTHVADSGYLRLYVAQLRKKLEPDPAQPRYLVTEAGMGYRFLPKGADSAEG
jgi:two-component system KDP operon response regulator KdpE